MTRKTGKAAIKARQLARSAKVAKYKRDLVEAGVSLSLPRPSAKAAKEKEEELRRLYKELFPERRDDEQSADQGQQADEELRGEKPEEESEEEPEQEEQPPEERQSG